MTVKLTGNEEQIRSMSAQCGSPNSYERTYSLSVPQIVRKCMNEPCWKYPQSCGENQQLHLSPV